MHSESALPAQRLAVQERYDFVHNRCFDLHRDDQSTAGIRLWDTSVMRERNKSGCGDVQCHRRVPTATDYRLHVRLRHSRKRLRSASAGCTLSIRP